MSRSNTKSSYDSIPDFGLLYDSVPAYNAREDVPFYVDEARRANGPILELGCGTGRITLPIARAGCRVVGIDESRGMLARLREKVAHEPGDVRSRISVHPGDVRDFDLGDRFALVIAPFRVLQHLVSIEEQLGCLRAVARHLKPGGRFVFDVFNPHFDKLVGADGAEHDDTPALPLPDGRSLRRAFRVARVRWLDQVNEVELIYHVTAGAGANEQRYVHAFEMRWYLRAELLHLLARGGFRAVEIHGSVNRDPLADESPDLVICAERSER